MAIVFFFWGGGQQCIKLKIQRVYLKGGGCGPMKTQSSTRVYVEIVSMCVFMNSSLDFLVFVVHEYVVHVLVE